MGYASLYLGRVKMAHRKNYKFTNKRHTGKSVMSTVFGVISLVSLIVVVYLAYAAGGVAPVNYGITGVLVTVFAIVGIILAVLSLNDREAYRFFSWLGVLFNGLSLAGISLVLYIGANL